MNVVWGFLGCFAYVKYTSNVISQYISDRRITKSRPDTATFIADKCDKFSKVSSEFVKYDSKGYPYISREIAKKYLGDGDKIHYIKRVDNKCILEVSDIDLISNKMNNKNPIGTRVYLCDTSLHDDLDIGSDSDIVVNLVEI